MEDWRDNLLSRLPYYWSGENVDSLLSILASSLKDAENGVERIRYTRRLQEIEEDEDIAHGINLDKLAQNVGVIRDTAKFIDEKTDIDVEAENDEMLRRRTVWNIDLQQSDAIIRHIKDLVARGLMMYRVRTGLGGMVDQDRVEPKDFLTDVPPEWEVPEVVNLGQQEYISPSDIIIFSNREPRLEMYAPDSYHGKFHDLTNFYAVGVPWKAMPWSEGENSLIWRSQDSFDRPFYTMFGGDDLSSGVLSIEHDLESDYPVVSVANDEGEYVTPDSVSVGDGITEIDLSSYEVGENWSVRLIGTGFKKEFSDSDLDADNVLSVENNLDTSYPSVAIYDSNGDLREPDQVSYPDDATVDIDLTSLTVSGEWVVSLIGGENTIEYAKEFSQDDLGAREMEVIHALGVDSPGVLIVDSNGNEYASATVRQLNDDSILVTFPSSSTVNDTWDIKVSSSRAKLPKDGEHGWTESVWTREEEELHIEPLKKLVELTRPVATDVQIYGYGGMIWTSQDEFDDPSNPTEDQYHGWGSRWDGDVEETEYGMEELDDFWVNY